jgi:hypothetical protein
METSQPRSLSGGVPSVLLLAVTLLFEPACRRENTPRQSSGAPAVAAGELVVTFSERMQKEAGLRSQAAVEMTQPVEIVAPAALVDAKPLLLLEAELLAVEKSAELSKAQLERVQGRRGNEELALKTLTSAETQFAADRDRLDAARLRLESQWGEGLSRLDPAPRHQLVESLAAGTRLVRVEIPGSDTVRRPAAVEVEGETERFIPAKIISFAPKGDSRAGSRGLLVSVPGSGTPIASDSCQRARIRMDGEPQAGVIIPSTAVVRHAAEAWAYVQTGDDKFIRREVPLEHRLTNGWFVTSGFLPGENLVVAGAARLLDEELKNRSAE